MTMPDDRDLISTNGSLPEGAAVLEAGPSEIVHDIDLALDLARLGASPSLVRSVGGETAVRQLAAVASNGNGTHP